jgi:GNAT superfamily N-acetyltransferase
LADMPRVWELVLELAEFERLSHLVTGSAEALAAGLDRHFRCNVCEVDGRIVGYTLCFPTFSTFRAQPGLWLEDLYITPEQRAAGHGKAMLEALIEDCRREGYGRLEWSVLDWNVDAIGFYERMGATLLPDWRTCRITF